MTEEKISKNDLEEITYKIFLNEGLDGKDAKIISKHLVLANLRGVDSHGVSRVKTYVERLRSGDVNSKFEYELTKETPTSAHIDGHNSMGILTATKGMELAVNKAKESGIGIVSISNSNHCGMLADYVNYAAKENLIALAFTNAPPSMAPWGGKQAYFGTNPIAYGIPRIDEVPIIFDMATSVVARGKIRLAQKNNVNIPLGWAISKEGEATDSPDIALDGGTVLPVGAHKGYGLAFLVETLSAIVSGASFGPHIGSLYEKGKQNVGHFFVVFKVELFNDIDTFKENLHEMEKEIRNVPLAEGIEKIYLPGEFEDNLCEERMEEGIPLTKNVIKEINEYV